MYSYTFDSETGGIILNSTPTNFSKEPRPVYSRELDILGFDRYWDYEKQNDTPYLWAESNVYWYRGVQIAKIKGGDLYTAPELQPIRDENGNVICGMESGVVLQPIDIDAIPAKPKADLYGDNHVFRTCAYCRVSTDNDEQLSSFELQQTHYKHLVQDHPNWELRAIYADEGISGTSLKNRDQFNAMIEACKQGQYEIKTAELIQFYFSGAAKF